MSKENIVFNILNIMNVTRKHTLPSIKTLPRYFSLYGSKQYKGDNVPQRVNWFGNYEIAKSYQTKETRIHKCKTKNKTELININKKNESYFKRKFLQTKETLVPAVHLTSKQVQTIDYKHPYIIMTQNEKAYYEFCFAFGYLTVQEQVEFMKLIMFLIQHNYITMLTRGGISVAHKMRIKVAYYHLNYFAEENGVNRLSFYLIDRHAVMNLSMCLPKHISGIYQPNAKSFWFPDFIVYKMNIQEYILFTPSRSLTFDKIVE